MPAYEESGFVYSSAIQTAPMDQALTPGQNILRPQFAFKEAPEGFEDEDFVYVFDASNTPALVQALAPGESILNIPLQLQSDAEFIVRGIEVFDTSGLAQIRLRTPQGDYLQSDWTPALDYAGHPVPVEPAIPCPAAGVWLLDVANGHP